MHICIYIYIYIKLTKRHLKYSYVSIFTSLLCAENETENVKHICNHIK